MHELGLMCEVVELAVAAAAARQATVVHALTLRVGAMAGVDPEALAFAFDAAAAGTAVAGAELRIEIVPVACRCADCGGEFAPPGAIYACPACGAVGAEARRGAELELASLEVS